MEANKEVEEKQITEPVKKASTKKEDASFSSILLITSIFIVIMSLPFVAIRLNILDSGEIVRPYIKNNSRLQVILPPIIDPQSVESMNREQLLDFIKKNEEKIAELEKNLIKQKEISEIYTNDPNGFDSFLKDKQSLIDENQKLLDKYGELQKDRDGFSMMVAKQDLMQFKEYYEKTNPETAKELYKLALEQEKENKATKEFVEYFENMDANTAAQILDKISKTDIMLVTNIIKNMDKQKASKILSTIDPIIASRISSILAGRTSINQ